MVTAVLVQQALLAHCETSKEYITRKTYKEVYKIMFCVRET